MTDCGPISFTCESSRLILATPLTLASMLPAPATVHQCGQGAATGLADHGVADARKGGTRRAPRSPTRLSSSPGAPGALPNGLNTGPARTRGRGRSR